MTEAVEEKKETAESKRVHTYPLIRVRNSCYSGGKHILLEFTAFESGWGSVVKLLI